MRSTLLPEPSEQKSLSSYTLPPSPETSTPSSTFTVPHSIEPELLGLRPRTLYWNQRTVKTRRLLWNLMFGSLFLLLFFARNNIANWNALLQHGVVTQGKIYKKHTPRSRESTPYIRFTVPTDSGIRTGRNSISWSELDSFEVGQFTPITYLPGHKGKIWEHGLVTPERRDHSLRRWIIEGCLLLGVFGLAIASYEASWWRQKRLLQSGLVAIGQIVSGYVKSDDGSKSYYLTYHFTTKQNDSYKGVISVSPSMYEQCSLGKPPITILYDANNPDNNIPYFRLTAARLAS